MLFLGKFHEHSHFPWHQSRNYRRASFALCRASPQTIWFQKHGPLKDVISEDAPLPRGSIFGMTGMWAKWPAVTPTLFGALAFHGFQVSEMLGNAARELAECWVLLPSGRKWWKRCGTQRAVEVLWMWRFTWHSLWATNGETWDGIDLNGSTVSIRCGWGKELWGRRDKPLDAQLLGASWRKEISHQWVFPRLPRGTWWM